MNGQGVYQIFGLDDLRLECTLWNGVVRLALHRNQEGRLGQYCKVSIERLNLSGTPGAAKLPATLSNIQSIDWREFTHHNSPKIQELAAFLAGSDASKLPWEVVGPAIKKSIHGSLNSEGSITGSGRFVTGTVKLATFRQDLYPLEFFLNADEIQSGRELMPLLSFAARVAESLDSILEPHGHAT